MLERRLGIGKFASRRVLETGACADLGEPHVRNESLVNADRHRSLCECRECSEREPSPESQVRQVGPDWARPANRCEPTAHLFDEARAIRCGYFERRRIAPTELLNEHAGVIEAGGRASISGAAVSRKKCGGVFLKVRCASICRRRTS